MVPNRELIYPIRISQIVYLNVFMAGVYVVLHIVPKKHQKALSISI